MLHMYGTAYVQDLTAEQRLQHLQHLNRYMYIYIYRLPPLPPTSQKVGWGRLLEALADLGCSLVAFCSIWDVLGSAGQPK